MLVSVQEPASSLALSCKLALWSRLVLHTWRTLMCCQLALLEPESVNAGLQCAAVFFGSC